MPTILLFGAVALFIFLCGYVVRTLLPFDRFPFFGTKTRRLQKQINQDLQALSPILDGLLSITDRFVEKRGFFLARTLNDISEQEKQEVLDLWGVFLDHQAALTQIVERYRYFYQISYTWRRVLHAKAFFVGYVAFLSAYANGVRVMELVLNRSLFDLILNDPDAGRGIPAGAYDALSYRILHVDGAMQVLAGYQYYQFLRPVLRRCGIERSCVYHRESLERSFLLIKERLGKRGGEWLPKNGARLFQKAVLQSVFPLQKHVAEAMGHARWGERKHFFITEEQVRQMRTFMQPGDIILERRNWYVSNVGIPGFWPHAALYLGTYQDACAFFAVPEVLEYVHVSGWSDVAEAIQATHPSFFENYAKNAREVLEAKAEGVILTPLSESACADYVAVLRPQLSRLDLFKCFLEAIHHYGKPYDYTFDFVTDSALVCSELIYKTYKSVLSFPLTEHVGRLIVPATTFARMCDEDRDLEKPRLTCVVFLDGSEREQKAFFSTPEALYETWKRPKWDMAQK